MAREKHGTLFAMHYFLGRKLHQHDWIKSSLTLMGQTERLVYLVSECVTDMELQFQLHLHQAVAHPYLRCIHLPQKAFTWHRCPEGKLQRWSYQEEVQIRQHHRCMVCAKLSYMCGTINRVSVFRYLFWNSVSVIKKR